MRKAQTLLLLLIIVSLALPFAACRKKQPPPIEPPETTTAPPMEEPIGEPPPPETQQIEEGALTDTEIIEISRQLQPVFYDYNRSEIRDDQIAALENNARVLRQNKNANVLIEGHCDERGTNEYNLALGDRRANAAKEYLVSLGIEESRVSTISYGEDRPFAEGHNESAWQQNRRAHFKAIRP